MTTKMDQISGASFTLSPQSPSFTTYSSENVADVAARVVRELNLSHDDPYEEDFYAALCSNDAFHENDDNRKPKEEFEEEEDDDDDDESEFEFAVLCGEDNSSPISADEIFSNGQIKPMFPIFNTDLVYGYTAQNDGVSEKVPETIRLPLRKLFQERDRESRSSSRNGGVSCSSSEGDDLEGVPPGTYCVWTPKKKEEVTMRKKSKSTGSSKRWRFKDLLYRSNSDGKDTFVFLTPSMNHNKGASATSSSKKMVTIGGKKKVGGGVGGGGVDGGRKKSYLPYRQDLVGFFANVNGISRTVRPF